MIFDINVENKMEQSRKGKIYAKVKGWEIAQFIRERNRRSVCLGQCKFK